jgi:hypothetical protein
MILHIAYKNEAGAGTVLFRATRQLLLRFPATVHPWTYTTRRHSALL